jgi:hypothetical protein
MELEGLPSASSPGPFNAHSSSFTPDHARLVGFLFPPNVGDPGLGVEVPPLVGESSVGHAFEIEPRGEVDTEPLGEVEKDPRGELGPAPGDSG